MKRLIVIGAGGHARVLVEALQADGRIVAGYVTKDAEPAFGVMKGFERIGDDATLLKSAPDAIELVNGVGMTRPSGTRSSIFRKYRDKGFVFATVVHPSAVVASDVQLNMGAQVMAGTVLQPGVRIGANAIVNTGALLDHDTVVGDHAHVAPGARIAGDVKIGAGSHVGIGATIIQNVQIGIDVMVAGGAVVIADVPDGLTVKGIPARV